MADDPLARLGMTPEILLGAAAAARRLGNHILADIYESYADRMNTNAPAVGPLAATKGDEGTNPNPHQGVRGMTTVDQSVDVTEAVAQGVPESGDVFADMIETPDVDYIGDMIEVSWSGTTVHLTRSGARTVALRILAQLTQDGADTEAPEPPGALRRWAGTAEAEAALRTDMQ